MMLPSAKIRMMNDKDLLRVVELSHELGYPHATLKSVSENFQMGIKLDSHEYYVVELERSVVAWMSLAVRARLEAPAFLQIGALVVDRNFRGRGIGRMFLDFAEERARVHGLAVVGLISTVSRIGSHKFYLNAGFEKAKENFFFQKDIV